MLDRYLSNLKRFLNFIFNTILPPHCIVCGEAVDGVGMVSAQVWEQLDFIAKPYCQCCGIPFSFESDVSINLCISCIKNKPAYDAARSALLYNDMSRKLVLKFKSADQLQAGQIFKPWLYNISQEFSDEIDYVVPVPLHRRKLFKRRYNQASILAQLLAAELEKTVIVDGLVRLRDTIAQGSDKSMSRSKNVRGAFDVPERHCEKIKGKNFLLIDDVYASGSTVNECASSLKKQGADKVFVITIARSAEIQ